jgi:hypothetical protein
LLKLDEAILFLDRGLAAPQIPPHKQRLPLFFTPSSEANLKREVHYFNHREIAPYLICFKLAVHPLTVIVLAHALSLPQLLATFTST